MIRRAALIPARGGSKRIPRKNLRPFAGRPVIAWSIDAARGSGCFDRVIVSTDDDQIAELALSLGADVPFRRPPELADDHATTLAVIRHATLWLRERGHPLDTLCCLYATAPFVTADDLRRGREVLERSGADYAVSVTAYEYPIQRALRLGADGRLAMFHPEHVTTRSQDLEPAFHDAGQFYWGRADAFLAERPLLSPAAAAVPMPPHRVQDIDTEDDWRRAEWMFRAWRAQTGDAPRDPSPRA